MELGSRYLAKLSQLNMARLVPDRIVISPEAFFEIQSEITKFGNKVYLDGYDINGVHQTIMGIPVEVDPRLEANRMSIEIDI